MRNDLVMITFAGGDLKTTLSLKRDSTHGKSRGEKATQMWRSATATTYLRPGIKETNSFFGRVFGVVGSGNRQRVRSLLVVLVAGLVILPACRAKAPASVASKEGTKRSKLAGESKRIDPKGANVEETSIGVAWMEADGTIVLQLRAEGRGGIRGDAVFQYPVGHPQYQEIFRHLGGLTKGQSKRVPPWPEKEALQRAP